MKVTYIEHSCFSVELEKVILNMEKEKQDTFAEMNLKHNDYIREYIFKIEDSNSRYNNDVSFMNTQIQNLTSEKNRLELENEKMKELEKKVKFSFWEKADDTHTVVRFAVSWATQEEMIDELQELL